MKLASIYRHPVKGMTPEKLSASTLAVGGGLPFDRRFAFTSGNQPDEPQAGGWVPARTFLQMTVYPQLAKLQVKLDETAGLVHLKAPDGETAQFSITANGDVDGEENCTALLARFCENGPHRPIMLHRQPENYGHWDFTDTGISVLNCASLDWLQAKTGETIDPRRFRANLHIEGLQPWEEFALIGQRLRIGEMVLEVTRPAMRCAATSADPDTGDCGLNVPVLLRQLTGHLFFAVYARVIEGGAIAVGNAVENLGSAQFDPMQNLPPRTPPPHSWPRFVTTAPTGPVRLHPGGDYHGVSKLCAKDEWPGGRLLISTPS